MRSVIIATLLLSVIGSGFAEEKAQNASDVPPTLSVYYETLCPDSIKFIKNQLYPAFKEMSSHFKWDMVPFGKASIKTENNETKMVCQHGEPECQGNRAHACVLHDQDADIAKKMAFINCTLSHADLTNDLAIEKCAKENAMDFAKISECAASNRSMEMEKEYEKQTSALKPALTYVPRVDINNEMVQENLDKGNFSEILCKRLNDTSLDVCKKSESSGFMMTASLLPILTVFLARYL